MALNGAHRERVSRRNVLRINSPSRRRGEASHMLNFNISHPKSWQDIAKQIQNETNLEKLCQLSRELIAAIDSQLGPPVKKRPKSVKLNRKLAQSSTDC